MGYRFQHIEQLNYFRKFVAEHNLKEKTEDLINTHSEHEQEIARMLDLLKAESQQLHVTSMHLSARD